MEKKYYNLIKHFVIDLVMFGLLGGLFLFARKRIVDSILKLSAYAEQVAYVSQLAQEQSSAMLEEVQALTSIIEPLTRNLQLYVYVFFPVGLWLIWSLTQSLHYNILSKKNIFDLKAIGYFLLVNIPFFAMFLLLVELLFRQITVDVAINLNLFWVLVIFLILVLLAYFMQVFYIFMYQFKFLKALKKSFKLSLHKFHLLFPLTLGGMFIFGLAFVFLWNILIKIVSGGSGYVLSSIVLIALVFIFGYYRKFLVNFVRKKV